MKPIRVLSEELVRTIAAGEVISRPNDALKELLENALDANASRIEIELQQGGIKLIRVTDDGTGIPTSDLPLAVQRFATSKLDPNGELTQISSLGFRGEALWSIAFAAHLTITSRPAHQLGGTRWIVHQAKSKEFKLETVASAAGTSIEVRDLFAHFPARLASLESALLEARRAVSTVSRYVLHHPQIAWKLTLDDAVKINHTPGQFRDAASTVYGAMTANRLLKCEFQDGDYTIQGVTSRPELARSRRDRIAIAINGRPVNLEETVLNAILRAYSNLLPKGHAPITTLNVCVPPESINQNVHPGKSRVAFLDADRIEKLVFEGISSALREHPLVRAAPEPRTIIGPIRASDSHFPPLRYLGAYRDTYLLAEGDGDLWLIDQHAAHERIIFEELEDAFNTALRIELPEPELITLSSTEVNQFEIRSTELESWGLELEAFGANLYRVRSVPAVLIGLGVQNIIYEVISHALGASDAKTSVLSRLACHPAIKAGHVISSTAASDLLEALRACRVPWACPHGRPIALRWTERDLAHQFGRRNVRDIAREGD